MLSVCQMLAPGWRDGPVSTFLIKELIIWKAGKTHKLWTGKKYGLGIFISNILHVNIFNEK